MAQCTSIWLCGTTLVCCTVSLLACKTLIQACSHTDLVNCNTVWLVIKVCKACMASACLCRRWCTERSTWRPWHHACFNNYSQICCQREVGFTTIAQPTCMVNVPGCVSPDICGWLCRLNLSVHDSLQQLGKAHRAMQSGNPESSCEQDKISKQTKSSSLRNSQNDNAKPNVPYSLLVQADSVDQKVKASTASDTVPRCWRCCCANHLDFAMFKGLCYTDAAPS